jgi:hypothetical protein
MNTIQQKIKKIFPPLDSRSLALFRVVLGIIILLDLFLNKIPYIDYFYYNSGVYTKDILEKAIQIDNFRKIQKLSLLFYITSTPHINGFFYLTVVLFIPYILGYKARIFGLLGWICLLSIHLRNPYVVSGPDQLIITFLTWSLLLPIENSIFNKTNNKCVRSISSLGIIVQIAVIYFFNASLKNGISWKEGNAIRYALLEDSWIKPTAKILIRNPEVCTILNYATIYMEYGIALFLILSLYKSHLRYYSIALLIFLHTGIFILFDLGLFPLVSLCITLVLLPSSFWDRILKNFKNLELHWYYPTNSFIKNQLTNIFGYIFFILVFWKSLLSYNHFNNSLYYPDFMRYLHRTTLFFQYWSMYAPNPTLNPSWYNMVGTKNNNLATDLITKKSYKEESIVIPKTYIFRVFYDHIYVSKSDIVSDLVLERWALVEKNIWNRKYPSDSLNGVYIFANNKNINQKENTSNKNRVLISYSR